VSYEHCLSELNSPGNPDDPAENAIDTWVNLSDRDSSCQMAK